MEAVVATLVVLFLLVGYLFYRHLRMRLGIKDSNYGGVQHISRQPPPPPPHEEFLPGSRANLPNAVEALEQETQGVSSPYEEPKRTSNRRKVYKSKEDIKRSYMLEALLEKPKWNQNPKE
ncbi:hypothetical protein [Pontibacter sp. G13]|uniref:hypothetical protein n=1 Tax=Pontibacter sp. G13 TaxID=3074898 RepID=UPI00288AAAD8|nr:hypothetical protein [Pontibacter sp. G13]WNJ20524.1 hypothetical protein RJD25_08580 [Pontibacter sp. G13]